ncbi:MAG: GMC oxidoreductase [Ignavibacterium album]|uniref:GMC family oxidoreductase n=1 Tax=Ignavibacterium album TaxID=591197 RepID=UPI0026F09EC3|nr:GMC oxidoreductase [Ignavibacterium album]MCX8106226.1 GMC oxidoreductase [Ignavibacterium album]
METTKTDVLIIGSGFGAAAPALRLCEAGFNVLMIEKGSEIIPEKDFRITQDPKYFLKYLKSVESENIGFTFAEALGGGSGFYEMVSLRAPSKVFEMRDEEGRLYWPAGIKRQLIDKYYDISEKMLNVEQIDIEDIPQSGLVFAALMKNLGYSCDRARYAVKGCVGSGYCIAGCAFGAKQSLHLNYLPMAIKSGLKIKCNIEALEISLLVSNVKSTHSLKFINSIPYRYSIKCSDLNSLSTFFIYTKILILAGGTIGTAKLLLNSKKNLKFLSNQIGKNIAFNGSIKAVGLIPENFIQGDMFSGRSHPGFISYHFFDKLGITISSTKPLPIAVISSARLTLRSNLEVNAFWGKSNAELMKNYRKRIIILYSLGLTPPEAELILTENGRIIPRLTITEQLKQYYKKISALLHSILRRNGCQIIDVTMLDLEGMPKNNISFSSAHMVGSCRMGESKLSAVVDSYGEVFDYPGIFVTDGAAIPTSLAVNTSLTILANAERVAEYLTRHFIPKENSCVVNNYK